MNKIALKISIIYLAIGFLWILFSDKFLLLLSDESSEVYQFQTYKGWFYVLATAILLFLLIRREIRKKNKIERSLEKALIKAEESDRIKTAFLSNMSHEIRTPLNGILGFSNLLLDKDYPEKEKKDFLNYIISNGNRLLVLVNDIIDISRIQEKQLKIMPVPISVNELMDSIFAYYKDILKKRQKEDMDFQLKKGANDDFTIFSDPIRIEQILNNLIDNAIKHTSKGRIILGYEIMNDQICFFVNDTGHGIPESQLEKIFDRFYHPEVFNSGERSFGLGLSISKGLVELLQGHISVESQLNIGSIFRFCIPLNYQVKEQ